MRFALIFVGAMLSTLALTAWVRAYALRRQVMDIPNARSLHQTPTPRGGGLALVVPVLLVEALAIRAQWLTWPVGLILLSGPSVLALLGWCDDRRPLGAGLRFGVQLGVAGTSCLALWWLGGRALPGYWVPALALGMVWFINLFNFMDGSDGLAGSQSLAAGLGLAALALQSGEMAQAAGLLALAGASLGFLGWNWSPARIFMGDVGSCFLGCAYALWGVLAVLTGTHSWPFLILFAPFITDATLTLCWRMGVGERWWQAHRSHVYQRLILAGATHAQLAQGCLALVLLLCPLAWLAQHWPAKAGLATTLAYGLTVALWLSIRFRMRRKSHP